MTLGASDLVLCAGTLPRSTQFPERIEATVAGGFAAMSMWGRDYASARRDGLSDADIRARLDASGIVIAELDPAWWWLPGATALAAGIPARADSEEVFAHGEAELFRIAEVVGARSINAVDIFGGAWTIDDAAEAFAALCDRAASTISWCTSSSCRGRASPTSRRRGRSCVAPIGPTAGLRSTRGTTSGAAPTSSCS